MVAAQSSSVCEPVVGLSAGGCDRLQARLPNGGNKSFNQEACLIIQCAVFRVLDEIQA